MKRRCLLPVVWASVGCLTCLLGFASDATGADPDDLAARAAEFRTELSEKVLPYWYDRGVDWQRGGYVLSDDAARPAPPATEKMIVTQARMVWGFAHAYRKGYRDPQRDYLRAARQGYQFLLEHFRDPVHGGYYWRTDLEGRAVNDRKYLYGEAFVVYALVEYHRASEDPVPLRHAMDLYRLVQQHCHDRKHDGWGEHYSRDWQLLTEQDSRIEVERAGLKSANAHLHWMEALAELYEATKDREVRKSLLEALRLNQKYFYPKNPAKSCFHRQPNWDFVDDPRSAGLSYGHNVEFAWLMVRAEEVLGRKPSWSHFDAIMDHALKYGTDHERGGLYNRGVEDRPATDTDKVWWSQSEWMAALTDGLRRKDNPAYRRALAQLITFLRAHQINPADGIWLDTVTAEGKPKSTAKAHHWKANYHDVRAVVKFIEAFGGKP
jgi:mannobiose 2-epimerase